MEKKSLLASGVGKAGYLHVNQQNQNTLSHHIQKYSKWLKDLNGRHDTIKLLEENLSKVFSDINCTNVVLGQSPKVIQIKTKINKWNLGKLTSFGTACKP